MTDQFINRTLTITLLLSVSYALWLWIDNQLFFGLGVLLGAAWSCVNFYFIRHLVENLIAAQKNPRKICFLLGVKFPLLYSTGYAILRLDSLSPYALVYGITLFLSVTLAVGASTLLANQTEQASEQ